MVSLSLTLKMDSSSRQSMFRATVLATWTTSRAANATFSRFFFDDESCLKLDWIDQNCASQETKISTIEWKGRCGKIRKVSRMNELMQGGQMDTAKLLD